MDEKLSLHQNGRGARPYGGGAESDERVDFIAERSVSRATSSSACLTVEGLGCESIVRIDRPIWNRWAPMPKILCNSTPHRQRHERKRSGQVNSPRTRRISDQSKASFCPNEAVGPQRDVLRNPAREPGP